VLGRDVPIGSVVVVHDFGAGTFDASVVARTSDGFEVLAVDGRDDIGGLDVDAAIVDHLRTTSEVGDGPEWRRLIEPETVADRRAQRQLWDDVRIVKERLSRAQSADLVLPLLNTEVHLTRDELEKLARPVLDQTVQVTRSLIRWAELPEGRLAGVFLVGGASRIPLVATLLHRELGEAPVVIEQPELVVAEGSILADAALLASGPAAPGPTAELRLLSARRRESETVRVAASPRPDAPAVDDVDAVPSASRTTAGLQPAVDPWPHAAPTTWTPDPAATVIKDPPVSPAAPPPSVTRPMSPPARTTSPTRRWEQPQPPPAPPRQTSRPASRAKARPSARTAPQRPPKRRRRGRFVRFLQILLSVLALIAVPLVAMLLAYGYGNGDSIEQDARHVIEDIARLVGLSLR
jgi:hypothetical protein